MLKSHFLLNPRRLRLCSWLASASSMAISTPIGACASFVSLAFVFSDNTMRIIMYDYSWISSDCPTVSSDWQCLLQSAAAASISACPGFITPVRAVSINHTCKLQQHQQRPRTPTSRQIPVVYEGEGPYVRSQHPQDPQCAPRHPSHGDHGYSRPVHAEPFTENSDRGQRLRRPQLPEDPFNGFRRSSFFNDPLFGWWTENIQSV